MIHWAYQYHGKPHVRGAKGPDSYDCLGLTQAGLRHFDIELADPPDWMNLREASQLIAQERENWIQVDLPQEGDVVLMARRKIPVHIGLWINANGKGGVLHCYEGAGVLFTERAMLAVQGWSGVTYFRHRSRYV